MSYSSEMRDGEQMVRGVIKPTVCSFEKITEIIKWTIGLGIETRVFINGVWYEVKD